MRSGRRTREQRLNSAKTRRDDRDRRAPHELVRALGRRAQLEAQHTTEAAEEFTGALVSWMRFKAGVVHACHFGTRLQELRNPQRALVLVTHAKRQRLEAAIQQESRVRIHAAAEMIELVTDALDRLLAAGDGAANDVGVPVQVFGRAVQ